jgi:hypothetical protein
MVFDAESACVRYFVSERGSLDLVLSMYLIIRHLGSEALCLP